MHYPDTSPIKEDDSHAIIFTAEQQERVNYLQRLFAWLDQGTSTLLPKVDIGSKKKE